MAATTAGAVKVFLEAQGLGVSVYRDAPPPASDGTPTAMPYVTVTEAISVTADDHFNPYDDPEGHVRELVQVDIWQRWRDPATGAIVESYSLPDAITFALVGARLNAAPTTTSGCVVQNVRRLLEPAEEPTIVHHAITVELRRQLSRTGA